MSQKQSSLQRHTKRAGVTLVAVVVCLGLITVLLLSAFHSSLNQRRQLDRELQMEQTRWLARAAIAHIAHAAAEAESTPVILRAKFCGDMTGKVHIEFEKSDTQTLLTAVASIGPEDRPEQSTQFKLQRILLDAAPKNSSRE